VIDLMAALKASLGKRGKAAPAQEEGGRSRAASRPSGERRRSGGKS
jgi:non-homologous end joining protein Ku